MFSGTSADDGAQTIPHNGCGYCNAQVRSIARRIDGELTRPGFAAGVSASLTSLGFAPRARAQGQGLPSFSRISFSSTASPTP